VCLLSSPVAERLIPNILPGVENSCPQMKKSTEIDLLSLSVTFFAEFLRFRLLWKFRIIPIIS
jgi:hypothetical protein